MSVLILLCLAAPQPETHWLYRDGPVEGVRVRPWSSLTEERIEAGQRAVVGNLDHAARPWAGVTFQREAGEPLRVDAAWLELGFVRFLFNAGYDRYGSPNAELPLQARPLRDGLGYERVNTDFIDRGNGLDEDPGTWQEVLIPLRYWTDLEAGDELTGLSLQCVGLPPRTFAFAEVGFVRLPALPEWLRRRDEAVLQPEVEWPSYDELPAQLRADREPPRVADGMFVGGDGRRVFVLNPYCREDHRLDQWGTLEPDRRAPAHGLFDPARHGWIYDELLDAEALCRLGFNSYSATMPAQPWWDAVGYDGRRREEDAALLAETYRRLRVPFFVDTVCWPWTIGAPAGRPEQTNLPPEAITTGANHWTPYRLIGPGREAWLRMWRLYAERYREAGVPVLMFELFNEPAYRGVDAGHRAEFAAWLQARYESMDRLNATWQSEYADWTAAAAVPDERETIAGRFFDYDEYLSERFTALVADGVVAVGELLPDALVGVQTMGGFVLEPREAVWKHRFVAHESVVLAPTGGGRWTAGGAAAQPAEALGSPIAPAPLETELLRALAGPKMLYDNETYLSGQTSREVRNRLWKQVFAGLDGLTVFSWSRRGWAWWRDAATIRTEADKYPYSALNPFARRTDALRGIHDFAAEVQPLADAVLQLPPRSPVGLIYSWPQARRRAWEAGLPDKTAIAYAALKYAHWQPDLLPSDRPFDHPLLIAAGIRYADAALLDQLRGAVTAGATLIVTDEAMALDLYGNPLETADLLGLRLGELRPGGPARLELPDSPRLSGDITPLAGVREATLEAGCEVILRDSLGRAVVTRHRLGRGQVCMVLADLAGYRLARLLEWVVGDAVRPAYDIRDATTGRLATNVLIAPRGADVLLLLNQDAYAKRVRFDAGPATALLTGQRLAGRPLEIELPAGEPVVLRLDPAT